MTLRMEDAKFYLDENTIIAIEWREEDDPTFELEHYGEPQNQAEEWVVDRQRGLLLGEWKSFTVSIPCESLGMSYFNEDDFWVPDNDWQDIEPTRERFAQAYKILEPLVEAAHIDCEEWDVEYDSNDNSIYVFLEGYQVVSDEPSNNRYERNSYKYFKTNLDDVTEDGKVNPKYVLQNYKAWDTYGDSWWLQYPRVSIIRIEENGYEDTLAIGHCFSISSESDEGEIKEVLTSALAEAFDDADIRLSADITIDKWMRDIFEAAY